MNANECTHQARRCDELAAATRSAEGRAEFLLMATQWRLLAAHPPLSRLGMIVGLSPAA